MVRCGSVWFEGGLLTATGRTNSLSRNAFRWQMVTLQLRPCPCNLILCVSYFRIVRIQNYRDNNVIEANYSIRYYQNGFCKQSLSNISGCRLHVVSCGYIRNNLPATCMPRHRSTDTVNTKSLGSIMPRNFSLGQFMMDHSVCGVRSRMV